MKDEYTTFDTATDGGFKATPPGIYPAHVSSFDSNNWKDSIVFNLSFKLADDVKEVQFVSITVDPQVDDKNKLSEYADLIGVNDERWQFLWSDISSIKDLKKNGFMLFSDNLPEGHAIKFVLIDPGGNIRKYYDGTDDASQEVLRQDIARLVRDLRS